VTKGMSERRGVRVVKRGERERRTLAGEVRATDDVKGGGGTAVDSTREMVSTVSSWVRDFHSRSEAEARQSFESLFKRPRPGRRAA
jgi:hypothetical protein